MTFGHGAVYREKMSPISLTSLRQRFRAGREETALRTYGRKRLSQTCVTSWIGCPTFILRTRRGFGCIHATSSSAASERSISSTPIEWKKFWRSSSVSTRVHSSEVSATERVARDHELLDLLDSHQGVSFEGEVFRIVREGIDALQGYPAKARWDPGTFDVLYTSLEREGALEEIHFHLAQQPVFPSRLRSSIYRIAVQHTLKFADLEAVRGLGVSAETYA